ncbi:SDR family oxidoreductase [Metabacillus iocasae]|uniref:3-oxoacyl-[acyl-carrier protein] reductase n=1 Tax=Priestia iocasae TaxID=2291674 RepID=A0ABS2QUY3_9BACI|nr:SDR family oxidoreductase [Metabacillus iocasae]MBM7703286.1 3-oxoacyl-[acyl-carrier protein] reductase [Metabacillus iocasae]
MIANEKVAFITGSATGIGKRTAIELAKQGIHIVINYMRSEEQAFELARYLEKQYRVTAIALQGDISSFSDCERMVEVVKEQFGRIDLLINNAGPYVFERKSMVEYDVDEWHYLINGNLNAVFYLCKLIVPIMREQRWGRIVNFGFDRAETATGWVYRSAFAAAKVGLVSLTKTLSLEEAKHGITVNMVSPGDITGEWKEADIESAQSVTEPHTPVGRVGTGEDLSRVIAFLCDDKSDFMTGNVIPITGGKDVLGKIMYEQ